jgi:hypothetical protein
MSRNKIVLRIAGPKQLIALVKSSARSRRQHTGKVNYFDPFQR